MEHTRDTFETPQFRAAITSVINHLAIPAGGIDDRIPGEIVKLSIDTARMQGLTAMDEGTAIINAIRMIRRAAALASESGHSKIEFNDFERAYRELHMSLSALE